MDEKRVTASDSKVDTNGRASSAMDSESNAAKLDDGKRRPRRRRMKSRLIRVIEKMESTLLGPKHRQPAWLKELLLQKDDQWIPIQPIVERLTSGEEKKSSDLLASKGFLPLLRESKLLEVDAHGAKVRAKAATNVHEGAPLGSDCILYVDNLPGGADDDWLLKAFSPYGRLIDAWVIKPRNKAAVKARAREEEERKSGKAKLTPSGHRKNKGFGFVQFSEASIAAGLLSKFHGRGRDGTGVSTASKSHCRERRKKAGLSIAGSNAECVGVMESVASSSEVKDLLKPTSSSSRSQNGKPPSSFRPKEVKKIAPSISDSKMLVDSVPSTSRFNDVMQSTPSTSSKRKNTGEVDSALSSKRSRMEEKLDGAQQPSGSLCNGRPTDNDGETVDGNVKMDDAGSTKKRTRRKRNRRRHRETIRHRFHEQAISDKLTSSLRIYSWADWHECKKAYLEKQKQSYSRLKKELGEWKSEANATDGILKKKARYSDGKELRGREKVTLKAEAAIERRNRAIQPEEADD